LDIIFEPKEQSWQIPQDDIQFDPLCRMLEIRKWGILQSGQMGKTKEQITYTAKKSLRRNST
jgi:hypothetical protein